MLKARTLTVLINRPIQDVYDFLVEPANLARWTLVGPGQAEPEEGPLVWSFDGPHGLVLVRFTPRNAFFVLDYSLQSGPHVLKRAVDPQWQWMRVEPYFGAAAIGVRRGLRLRGGVAVFGPAGAQDPDGNEIGDQPKKNPRLCRGFFLSGHAWRA